MKAHLLAATLFSVALAGSVTTPASARDGWSPGAAAAVGVLGGLAIGGAIGSAHAAPYYPGRPVYSPPPPRHVVYGPPRRVYREVYDDGPVCYVKRRRIVDEFGDVFIRRVQVCE
jgi:hypothetical protein